VSAANGAEAFFSHANNHVRSEGIELARKLDEAVSQAWLGHPSFDIIDNSTGFLEKKNRVVEAVLKRLGLNDTRHGKDISKRKFLLRDFKFGAFDPCEKEIDQNFPVSYKDFLVQHDYLLPQINPDEPEEPSPLYRQTRLRKRECNGHYLYSLTHRNPDVDGQIVEVRRTLTHQAYEVFFSQRDVSHCSIIKKRRCFVWQNQSYQLDYFESPPGHNGLVLLEAYVNNDALSQSQERRKGTPSPSTRVPSMLDCIPPFLRVEKEVTGDPAFSMFNLSKINQRRNSL